MWYSGYGVIQKGVVMKNVNMNVKHWLIKIDVIKDLFGILVSNCDCWCDKSCDKRQDLDYKNCRWRKRLVDKLVEEWSENIDGIGIIYDTTLNEKVSGSCTVYIVLFVSAFLIIIGISSAYFYFHWYLKSGYIETTIY